MARCDVIPFPGPWMEHYTIDYNPVTHEVQIPLVPDDTFAAIIILGVWMDMLLGEGTMDLTDLDTVVEGIKIAQKR